MGGGRSAAARSASTNANGSSDRADDGAGLGAGRDGGGESDGGGGGEATRSPPSSEHCTYGGYKVPDPADCRTMPRKYRSASNDVLSVLAAQGLPGARKERLLREIMAKDDVSWPVAREKLYEINLYNDRFGMVFQMPFRVGVVLGLGFGFGCIPLVFHKDTAVWFNDTFVHEELPDDLSNFWQVGEWTWGWMEPALGTLSFTLLALQMTRQYMLRMQWAPYTDHINNYRADRLARKYAQYEREIIRDFAKSDSWVDTAKAEHRKIVDEEIRMGLQEDADRLEAAAATARGGEASSSKQ